MTALGADVEHNKKNAMLDRSIAATTPDAMMANYEEEQLLAQGKARLMRADPVAMQFLMGAMDGGIPQKLTANEIMIGQSQNPATQGLAGDDITRAIMGR
jgi:hypothetical protein